MIKIQVLILRGFCQKKGEFACNVKMWSHGIKRYPITTIKESFFFAFLSNTHTEIQLGIVGLDVGV